MVLSNREIHKALDNGRLIIKPEPQPRVPTLGQDCPYGTHSVDLKLHNEIFVPEGGKFSINLREPGSLTDLITKNSKKYVINDRQGFDLKPMGFILAQTVEWIGLPIKNGPPYLAARIEGKSSRARCGLIVHCTAPTVHPGWGGKLTLEMVNLGPATITLTNQMYIAQLIIEQVEGEIIQNPSDFQGQTHPSGAKS